MEKYAYGVRCIETARNAIHKGLFGMDVIIWNDVNRAHMRRPHQRNSHILQFECSNFNRGNVCVEFQQKLRCFVKHLVLAKKAGFN